MRFQQCVDLVDVGLLGSGLAHAFQRGPGIELGAIDHVEHAGTAAADIAAAGLLEVGVELQHVLVGRTLREGFDIELSLFKSAHGRALLGCFHAARQ